MLLSFCNRSNSDFIYPSTTPVIHHAERCHAFLFFFSLPFFLLLLYSGTQSSVCLFTVSGPLWVSLPPPHAASRSRCECVLSAGSSTRSCWCKSARPLKDQDGLSGLINGLVARPAAADTVFRRRTGSRRGHSPASGGLVFLPSVPVPVSGVSHSVCLDRHRRPPKTPSGGSAARGREDEQQKVWGKVSNKWCLGMCAQLACVRGSHALASPQGFPSSRSRPSVQAQPSSDRSRRQGAFRGGGGVRGHTPRTRGHGNTAGLRS